MPLFTNTIKIIINDYYSYEPNESDEFAVFVHGSREGEYEVLPEGIKNM